jgi:hypothetical protein
LYEWWIKWRHNEVVVLVRIMSNRRHLSLPKEIPVIWACIICWRLWKIVQSLSWYISKHTFPPPQAKPTIAVSTVPSHFIFPYLICIFNLLYSSTNTFFLCHPFPHYLPSLLTLLFPYFPHLMFLPFIFLFNLILIQNKLTNNICSSAEASVPILLWFGRYISHLPISLVP